MSKSTNKNQLKLSEVTLTEKLEQEKKSENILLQYEFTKILGMRYQQLQNGAQPLIDTSEMKEVNLLQIAKNEILYKLLPIYIRREHENGQDYDLFKLQDLIIPKSLLKM